MRREILRLETGDRGYDPYSIHRLRVRVKKIMLGQIPHKTIPAENESKRLDDCCLATVIRPDNTV
jgi:hypothetical protein